MGSTLSWSIKQLNLVQLSYLRFCHLITFAPTGDVTEFVGLGLYFACESSACFAEIY